MKKRTQKSLHEYYRLLSISTYVYSKDVRRMHGTLREHFSITIKKDEGSKKLNEMVSSTIENMKTSTKKKTWISSQRSMSYLMFNYIYIWIQRKIYVYTYINWCHELEIDLCNSTSNNKIRNLIIYSIFWCNQ